MLDNLIIVPKEEFLEIIKEYPLYDARTIIEFAESTNNKDFVGSSFVTIQRGFRKR